MSRLTPLLADWAALNDGDAQEVSADALAEALLRACDNLTDEVLRGLAATPDAAAAVLSNRPFADRVDGAYLPFDWLESLCSALRLPLSDIDAGWDISDGEDVYLCPRAMLADDPDAPDDTRAFVRVDQIRPWPTPG